MSYDTNPYYDPEKFGLKIVHSLEDGNACWSFDTIVLWYELATKKFFAAHDSGCSCPTPFEGINSTSDMVDITSLADLRSLVGTHFDTSLDWDTESLYTAARNAGLR